RGASEEDRGEHHRGDGRYGVRLEQVRRHSGAVADIITNVVGNGRRIARVIFRNARLNLANEITADISAFGEDTAAEARKYRDQRSAEAERDEGIDHRAVIGLIAERTGEDQEIDGD